MDFLRQYLVALQSFTRVPVTGPLAQQAGATPDTLRASAAHFPGVGWLVGLVACASFALLALLLRGSPFTPLVAAIGCTVATALLTGARHEGGLARLLDTQGVLALVLALLLKVSLLAVLAGQSEAGVLLALFAAHTLSRFAPLLIVQQLAHVGDAQTDKSQPLTEQIGTRELAIAGVWCIPPLLLALFVRGVAFVVVPLLLAALAWWLMKSLLARRLQGFTGDGLGATQQVCEIAFYLGAAIAWNLA